MLVTFHLNMHHVRFGGELKNVSTQSHPNQAIRLSWGWFEMRCNNRQFFQVGSPQSHCIAPHSWISCGDYQDNAVFVALPVTNTTQKMSGCI